jgi:hypothetical protein
MAIGEGGVVTGNSANSSTNPVTIADFKAVNGNAGPDGRPANAFSVSNPEASAYWQIYIPGINSLAHPYPLGPSKDKDFQLGHLSNDITQVFGWPTNTANASDVVTTGTYTICGGVFIRKG